MRASVAAARPSALAAASSSDASAPVRVDARRNPLVPGSPLACRQQQIVEARFRGYSHRQIGERFGISAGTVSSTMQQVRLKLAAATDEEVFSVLLSGGHLLTPPPRAVPAYSTWLRGTVEDLRWQPSAAQRLYLTAFDRLLLRGDVVAAAAMDLAFRLMCWEGRVGLAVRTFRAEDVADRRDAMLLGLARALLRPIPLD